MGEVEEPCIVLVGVRLEIKQVADLVGRRHAPPFKVIENIECRKHSISVGGDLKGANVEVVCHPRETLVQRQSSPCTNIMARPGGIDSTWLICSLSGRGPLNGVLREPKVLDILADGPSSQSARTTRKPLGRRARPSFWNSPRVYLLRGTIRSSSRRRSSSGRRDRS